ncbi:hypothetical protein CGZ98_16265 [Enemella evansiae]|uniref:hypothetical protein n=1 Tax=Enemella evansiae TaxID=2016499 RepID=UPI000B97A1EE|nr:hypothetical protein [Enemella evansiae]OYO08110.1 hypothetical protein CGZ98_16265 [Enemella evansiae]
MRTLATFAELVADAARMWLTAFPALGMWFCLGFVLDRGLFQAAITVGGGHAYLALLLFILGVLASVAATVLMIGALEPQLTRLALLRERTANDPKLPVTATLDPDTSRGVTLALALGPFLAVYALWGLVDDRIRELFVANQIRYSLNPDAWSIDLRRWQGYLLLALIAWLIKLAAGALHRRFGRPALAGLAVLADGVFVFASFLGLYRATTQLVDWLTGRVVWQWVSRAWRGFLEALPNLRLPFDLTLPEAVADTGRWLTATGLPALGQYLLLPLVWLALTAVVFGWRTVHEIDAGSRLGRLTGRLTKTWEPLGRVVDLATLDVREKYLPVWRALRLIAAAGPRFIGCYLLAATALSWLRGGFEMLTTTVIGPVPAEQMLFLGPLTELLTGLVFSTLAIALYAAAFDRCLLTARRVREPSRAAVPGRQPGSGTRTRVPASRPS